LRESLQVEGAHIHDHWSSLCSFIALVLDLIKMNISQPVPSAISSVDFGFLSREEIKSLSVKRIENPQTFDTLLHPVPGGLYDPALGAWGDVT